eukprot:7439129-Alexandrium_andersonii.AAC.1
MLGVLSSVTAGSGQRRLRTFRSTGMPGVKTGRRWPSRSGGISGRNGITAAKPRDAWTLLPLTARALLKPERSGG